MRLCLQTCIFDRKGYTALQEADLKGFLKHFQNILVLSADVHPGWQGVHSTPECKPLKTLKLAGGVWGGFGPLFSILFSKSDLSNSLRMVWSCLQMCILDGKGYTALQEAGREGFEEDVEACIIASNNQGKELLVPGRNATHNEDKWVVVQLARGQAYLPDLSVTGAVIIGIFWEFLL